MTTAPILALVLLVAVSLVFASQIARRRRLVRERLRLAERAVGEDGAIEAPRSAVRRWSVTPWVVPVIVGGLVFAILHARLGVHGDFAISCAVVATIVTRVLTGIIEQRRSLKIEQQLADAVDILAASLQAGLAVSSAIEAAAAQSRSPLREAMEALSARLRLGEDPREVFDDFERSIGGPSARLLAFTLAIHWEVGGSIAHALRNVAKVVRDRIELSRRVKAQAAEAELSVIGVLAITYAVGGLMWISNPEGSDGFFGSTTGSRVASLIVLLQAAGMVWMRRLTRLQA